ncbi:ATP-grasp domain-containing protein [Paludibaculum fermentans]|uniref:ATP-grasp domain-containing protein n=1 Tax=Paludibaculum fermentans TaxID=1473598 RepID=UPI003EBE25FD
MKILIVASKLGYQTRSFTEVARRLGLEPILATDRCGSLEDPWGDQAFPLKFHQPAESAERLAREISGIAGIVAVGDLPAVAAAHIAARLCLPFHSTAAVEAAGNKYLARERFAAAGLPVPTFFRVPLATDPAEAGLRAPWPCVLKPLGLSGSRGVIRANNPDEFVTAFERIRTLLNAPELLRHRHPALGFIQVEEYIPGREFALEGLMIRGKLQTLAIFDKPDPLEGPFFEETLYVTPSREPLEAQAAMSQAIQGAATALGLSDGPIHSELRWNDRGAWVLEVAARPIGGLCSRVLTFNGGTPLEEVILRHALGHPLGKLTLDGPASGVMMIPIPRNGLYEGCSGVEAALGVGGIDGVEITAQPGQRFQQLPEGSSYLGFLFARGPAPAEVEASLRRAHGCLQFQFATALPVMAKPQRSAL